jgi:microcystin-dependent protein
MSLDRTHLTDKTADNYASVDDINNVYDAVNNLKDNAADMTAGLFTSSNLEVDTDATTAGDRDIKFWLTASTWIQLLWDNTNTIFKLVNNSGTLQKLAIADGTSSTHAATKSQVDTVQANVNALQLEVTGAIKLYGGSSSPTGYLWCDGAAVSRSTYSALFTALGTTFGSGDGSTTFNVPDLRGRVPLGKDNMGGSTASRVTSASTNGGNATTLGGAGGAETHTLSTTEIPAHTHSYNNPNSLSAGSAYSNASANALGNSASTGSTGGGSAHSNTPPWLAINYIIKT